MHTTFDVAGIQSVFKISKISKVRIELNMTFSSILLNLFRNKYFVGFGKNWLISWNLQNNDNILEQKNGLTL